MTEFDKVIPPGGEGKVKASFDTAHYKGPTSKSIQVITNDAAKSPVVLQLKAEIIPAIDVQPGESVTTRPPASPVRDRSPRDPTATS